MGFKFDKNSYRIYAKNRLKTIARLRAKCYSYKLHKTFLNLLDDLKVKNILIFTPLFYEPDFLKLRPRLAKKYNILLPFMVDKSLKMVKLRLPFKISKFNVREANDSNAFLKRIDLAVIPVIGVDGSMARIGHGMGYYDKFISNLGYRPKILFVQIEDFYIKEKICDSHDITCDFYITPKRNYIRVNNDRDFDRLRSRSCRCWRRIRSR
ncbi:5,10-methenyltetrahydrofolate synthetase [Campylobacter iguaniorum]|uniref:5-formyltetrahydrofolate cyclo-ligase n=1 Tax=Campylobacter iguaniorum TaxID=1244531 RepID=UPI00073A2BBE|nr:5-formyltetrahydrofolate cyclo-ligase [Campylobacter iguaniorum]ALV24175.1 5,10-methenyltetrahydrofolate synthetase [Campylobacter iguaniorum]